jgi:hypothetical protein
MDSIFLTKASYSFSTNCDFSLSDKKSPKSDLFFHSSVEEFLSLILRLFFLFKVISKFRLKTI